MSSADKSNAKTRIQQIKQSAITEMPEKFNCKKENNKKLTNEIRYLGRKNFGKGRNAATNKWEFLL